MIESAFLFHTKFLSTHQIQNVQSQNEFLGKDVKQITSLKNLFGEYQHL